MKHAEQVSALQRAGATIARHYSIEHNQTYVRIRLLVPYVGEKHVWTPAKDWEDEMTRRACVASLYHACKQEGWL